MKQNTAKEMRLGALDVDGSITKISGEVFTPNKIDTSKISSLITNNSMNFNNAVNYVNRELRNMVREAQKETNKINVIDTANRKTIEEELKRKMVESGVVAVKTSNNRELQLDKYVKMATQTTLKIARNIGVIEQCKKRGIDLIKCSEHYPTCSICLVRQGRVYSISGTSKEYPSVYGDLFTGDYETIHPNCKHSFMPYLPEYLTEEQVEADKKHSNRSFETLNEFETQQLGRYNDEQRRKAKVNRIRKEYDNMKLTLGEDSMPSFTGYRNSRTRNGPLYTELKEKYDNIINPKIEVVESDTKDITKDVKSFNLNSMSEEYKPEIIEELNTIYNEYPIDLSNTTIKMVKAKSYMGRASTGIRAKWDSSKNGWNVEAKDEFILEKTTYNNKEASIKAHERTNAYHKKQYEGDKSTLWHEYGHKIDFEYSMTKAGTKIDPKTIPSFIPRGEREVIEKLGNANRSITNPNNSMSYIVQEKLFEKMVANNKNYGRLEFSKDKLDSFGTYALKDRMEFLAEGFATVNTIPVEKQTEFMKAFKEVFDSEFNSVLGGKK